MNIQTRCCIAGGGPAGMMLALLLARAGVSVVVLEKHADFLRDFRGDTVHPSTLAVLHELGLLESFLARPHEKVPEIRIDIAGEQAVVADFGRLRTRCRFIAMMPQWEFLDFIRDEAERYPGFRLLMETKAEGLVARDGVVCGVRASSPQGEMSIASDLVIGADGRHSTLREAAHMEVQAFGAPIDVLWMRIGKHAGDANGSGGRIAAGRFVALIDRGTYWQGAYVIHKGGYDSIRAGGLDAFRAELAGVVPMFAGRLVEELPDWDRVKLLSVSVDRLEQWWKPGLLFIGDAAHAMSPIGGVGINLAIQDAVAAGNILAAALRDEAVASRALTPLLAKVQHRRMFPTRVTQAVQVAAQERLISPLLDSSAPPRMPFVLQLLNRFPALRAIPAYAVGIGARPEHVRTTAERARAP